MVYNLKLKSLEINSFRGIKHYDLNFYDDDKYKSMVFCGANGTGKSSFVHAFEYLFTGEIEALKGAQGVKPKEAIIHKGDSKKDLMVTAQIGDYEISRSLTKGLQYPPELEDIVRDFENGSFILTRKKLLAFIDSAPKQRYTTIANLINFTQYDSVEESFRKCEKNLEKELKEKTSELKTATDKIEEIYDCKFDEAYSKTNENLKEMNLPLIDENSDLKKYILENSLENHRQEDLENIDVKAVNEKYLIHLKKYKEISLNELKSSTTLLSILNYSSSYISLEKPNKCPVCENEIDYSKILMDIDSKKEKLENNTAELKNWQENNKELIKEINELDYKLKNHNLQDIIGDLKELSEFEKSIDEMDKGKLAEISDEIEILKQDYSKTDAKLEHVRQALNELSERQRIKEEIEKLTKQHEISKMTYDLFSDMKKAKIEEILHEIIEHINEYYKFIHEDDSINSPEIVVDKSTALLLRLNFGDGKFDPRSYSSEGHIDTLGLCIFLAFVKEFNDYKFIVLDDIIATVDMTHKEKVIRLLLEKFPDYTFIITTHNKLWFEQLEAMSRFYDQNKFIFTTIQNWDEVDGPQLYPYVSQEARIDKYIEDNDVFAAGNGIRRYFEYVLDQVVRRNNIKMPLKKHYTVHDYYAQVQSHIKKVFKKSDYKEYYQSLFDELDKTTYMGNLMSHNNESNYYLDISEIILFRNAVFEFKKGMTCWNPNHSNNFLFFNNDKKIGMCSSKRCGDIFDFSK